MEKEIIGAFPAKRFFVDMLTRDIELQDAILDLLDNCLDGALRSVSESSTNRDKDKVYEGFEAKINFDNNGFTIEDNCGGISGKLATDYAFRLGRPNAREGEKIPTIGIYGIGMKRAIFKMGTASEVLSKTKEEQFKVVISPEWISNDDKWELELERTNVDLNQPGVKISVSQLREDVSNIFTPDRGFEDRLITAIGNHYSLIINKGFKVFVNNEEVKPSITTLMIDENAFVDENNGITPYFYRGESRGVSIKIAVGFYRDLVSDDEERSILSGKTTTEKAGWTIICNDRVVLHADKTRLTGWGEAGVPQYHTQFIGIAGVVIFTSDDAERLPITTTKRGVDGNSDIYLATKDFMREGMKLFTDFTNRWKGNSEAKRKMFSSSPQTLSLNNKNVDSIVPENKWSKVTRSIGGNSYKPKLPVPRESDPLKQIKFNRKISEIKLVSQFLFDDDSFAPTDVGNYCFEQFLERAKK
ncbi:ATP-binding protein [Serratia marcescens]|uniref:ATP-binding protein n=1 Tax=Serratia marcescens TaxID=615 RepID=UPI0036F566E0